MSSEHSLQGLVANVLCQKPWSLAFKDCFIRNCEGGGPCRHSRVCCIDEKTDEQLAYVTSDLRSNSFLRACPGSGKTEVVGLTTAYRIAQWLDSPGGLAVLTFTRKASDEISDRVGQYVRRSATLYPHFVGTIDSWLHQYIVQPFSWTITGYRPESGDHSVRVVDSDCRAGFLNAFKTKCRYADTGFVKANEYFHDVERNTFEFSSGYLGADTKRNSFPLKQFHLADLKNTKERFWAEGFATHEDMECMAYELVRKNQAFRNLISKRFPHMIIDECQDLSWVQLEILKELIDTGVTVHLVGDPNQAIYGFRKVEPRNVEALARGLSFREFRLTQNFRSAQPIVDLCGRLVPSEPTAKARPGDNRSPCCGYVSYTSTNDIKSLPARFEKYIQERRYRVQESAVLARGKTTLALLRPGCEQKPRNGVKCLATAIHLWCSSESWATKEALLLLGSFLADKCVKGSTGGPSHYYCPTSEKSRVAWRLFLWRLLTELCLIQDVRDVGQTWKQWTAHVRCHFPRIVDELAGGVCFDRVHTRVSAPSGEASKRVMDTLDIPSAVSSSRITVTTIHQAKGRTFDAVLLVSYPTKKGDGGHWSQWISPAPGDEEHARFGYVACSRAARLLVWAVPDPSEADVRTLEDLGLTGVIM